MSVNQKPHEAFAGLVLLEVPYGQSLVSDPHKHTFDDPRNREATEARFTPYLASFGVKSLAIHQEVPTHKQLIRMGEFMWELGLMDKERVYHVPEWVCDRMRALQRADIPFAWFLYADERLAYPKVAPIQTPIPAPLPQVAPVRKKDPAIIGVIPTDYERRIGWWYLIAAWLH